MIGSDLAFSQFSGLFGAVLAPIPTLAFAVDMGAQTKLIHDDRDTLPIQERLFLGGSTTVRSFNKDQLGLQNDKGEASGVSPPGGVTSKCATKCIA